MHILRTATISILSLLIGISALIGGFYVVSAFTGPTIAPPGGDGVIRADSSGNIGINTAPSSSFKLYVDGDFGLASGDQVDLDNEAGDKIFWSSNVIGTGVEGAGVGDTLTNWSTTRHRWRIGGTSVSTGVAEMILTSTGLRVNNTTDPVYALDVTGDINYTGALRLNGTPVTFGSQWTTSGSNIYYTTGNVGIGTSSVPLDPLTVTYTNSVATVPGFSVNSSGSQSLIGLRTGGVIRATYRGDNGGNAVIATTGTGDLYFTVGGQNRMLISDTNQITVGSTTAPNANTLLYITSSTSIGNINNSYGALLSVGSATTDFPGNTPLATTNPNVILTGSDNASIAFQDSGCCAHKIRYTANAFHVGELITGANPANLVLYNGLVLGSRTTAQAPTAVNGTIFYDTTLNKFRCYENSAWKDCIGGAVYQ